MMPITPCAYCIHDVPGMYTKRGFQAACPKWPKGISKKILDGIIECKFFEEKK